jgi:hypothetical protein
MKETKKELKNYSMFVGRKVHLSPRYQFHPGTVMNAYNPSTWKAEAGRSPVQGQFGLHSEPISKKPLEGGVSGDQIQNLCYTTSNLLKCYSNHDYSQRIDKYVN